MQLQLANELLNKLLDIFNSYRIMPPVYLLVGVVVGVVPLVAYMEVTLYSFSSLGGTASGRWSEVRGGRCTEVSKHISSM